MLATVSCRLILPYESSPSSVICIVRGGQKHKSQNLDGCPMDSRFIGLGLLRTVFGIVVACREGPAPEFCCIAGNIEGRISKNRFRLITFDWSVRGGQRPITGGMHNYI